MNTIHRMARMLILAGATSCLSCISGAYQGPQSPPPDYRDEPRYQDDRYDDNRYDDDRYDDDRYDGYRHSPDSEVGFFYQELSPYGDWVYTYDYGWTWLPSNVPVGWRPYYYGQWVRSDYGWFWASREPFGWATYHYGRWAMHPRFGWIWVPGRTWGPAWVSWRSGSGYIGWAPLPPEIGFDLGIGLRLGGFDLNVLIRPHAYTFVQERAFLEREPYRYAMPSARNVTIIHNTTNITNYTVVQQRIINRGVDIESVERATGRRVKPMRIAETVARQETTVRADEVLIYRPPKARLDTVRIDENASPRKRQPSPSSTPGKPEPEAQQDLSVASSASDLEVAPRVKAEPPMKSAQFERRKQQQANDLAAYERSERQRLEQIHRQEREKPQAAAEAAAIAQRQAEEKQALEEELRRSKQQLEARQEVEQRAAQAKPHGRHQGVEKNDDQNKGKQK